MLSAGGNTKWDSFWKERDNGRSLFNCSLVHVLISSAKWETLKTDKSTTNYGLQKLDVLTLPVECFFHLNLRVWVLSFFLFPVVKMNMVVSSQLSSITELNLTLLTAKTTGCRQVILSWLCSYGSNVTKYLGQGRSFISAQGWGHWSSNVL